MCTSLASTSVFGNARSRAQPRLRGLRDLRTVPGQGTGAPRPRSLGWGSSPDPPFPPPNLMFSRGFNTSWDSTAPTAGFRLNVCPETQSPRRGTFHLKEMQNGGGSPAPFAKHPETVSPQGAPRLRREAHGTTLRTQNAHAHAHACRRNTHTHTKHAGHALPSRRLVGKGQRPQPRPRGQEGRRGLVARLSLLAGSLSLR